jgi:membrane-anchored mycosin MYCP
VVCVLLGAVPVVSAGAASAPPCVTPAGVYREPAKWAQRLTDASDVWPLADGEGQLVAVVGTGVDPSNPQFADRVTTLGASGDDCDGRGTFAAGIVAAQPDPATTFAGVAPGARLLGVKYTEATSGGAGAEPDPDQLAAAITASVGGGATVVLVVLPAYRTSPALESAVRDAVAAGAVVVSPALSQKAGVRSYPTSLPGVIGVGAVDEAGAAVQQEAGDYISLAAPGADVVSTSAKTDGKVGHLWGLEDSPPVYASAAFVAGAAALIRSYHAGLTPEQVLDRLIATANRPPSGGRDSRLGWGVLDVPAAVTAELTDPSRRDLRPSTVTPAAAPAVPAPHDRAPGWLAVAGVVFGVLAIVGVRLYRRGRAAGWRP